MPIISMNITMVCVLGGGKCCFSRLTWFIHLVTPGSYLTVTNTGSPITVDRHYFSIYKHNNGLYLPYHYNFYNHSSEGLPYMAWTSLDLSASCLATATNASSAMPLCCLILAFCAGENSGPVFILTSSCGLSTRAFSKTANVSNLAFCILVTWLTIRSPVLAKSTIVSSVKFFVLSNDSKAAVNGATIFAYTRSSSARLVRHCEMV